jgi:dihydropteroate synthase
VLLTAADRRLDLSRPVVMGILNVTQDSFSDGGRFRNPDAALAHAREMVRAGAAIIDVGGESTRPGATPVSLQEELDRVLPVITAIRAELDVLISIDTMKPAVMTAAVAAGAGMVNDVNALQAPGAMDAVAVTQAAVCVMHMQGVPQTMQAQPQYGEVVAEVQQFLNMRAEACMAAGIAANRIVLDPGFGFGKTLDHNIALLNGLKSLTSGPYPVLVGLSRKSMIGKILGRTVEQRLAGSLALATLAAVRGALIIRSHDVAETLDAVTMAWATREH